MSSGSIDYKAFNLDDLVFDSILSPRGSTILKPKTFHTQYLNLLLYPVKIPFGVDFSRSKIRCDLKEDDGPLKDFLNELDAKCLDAIKELFEIDDERLNYIPILKNNRYLDLKINKHARTQKISVDVDNGDTLRSISPTKYYDIHVELVYLYLLDNPNNSKKTAGAFIVVKQIKTIQ